jgi:hypothetical protein
MKWFDWVMIAAVAVTLSLASSLSGEESGKSAKLPLKFEKGKEYVYRVEMDAKSLQAMQGTETQGSSQSRSGTSGSSGATEQEREKQEKQGSQAGAGSQGRFEIPSSGHCAFDYLITVKDTSAANTTLDVAVDQKTTMGPGAEGGSAGRESGSARESGAGRESKDEIKNRVQSAPKMKFTVQCDSMGRVTQFQGLEGATGSSAQGRSQSQTAGSFTQNLIRGQLHLILGTGLHTSELQAGQFYGPSAPGLESGGGTGQATPSRATAHAKDLLDVVSLRFDGTSREQGEEVAKFTVYAPEMAWPTPSSGRPGEIRPVSLEENPQGRSDTAKTGQTPPGMKAVGEATYETDEGWCHHLKVHGQFQTQGSSSSNQGQGSTSERQGQGTTGSSERSGHPNLWLSIKRIGT